MHRQSPTLTYFLLRHEYLFFLILSIFIRYHFNFKFWLMKTFIFKLFFSISFLFSISGYGQIERGNTSETLYPINDKVQHIYSKNSLVYICDGLYAYAYHSSNSCPGLNNCKGPINLVAQEFAINIKNRRPCCRCWSNVGNNCADDYKPAESYGQNNYSAPGNQSYTNTGGSGPDAGAALVLILVGLGNSSHEYYLLPFTNLKDGSWGVNTGFRSYFANSALEYGATLGSFSGSTDGIHINYLHKIFYNKTPKYFKPYIGPSINYIEKFGYGIILGAETKINSKIAIHTRGELTTNTAILNLGFILRYRRNPRLDF